MPAYLNDLDIRLWLRDNDPEANTLLDELEFSNDELAAAKNRAVDRWNETPPTLPNSHYNTETFPYRYYYTMGVVSNLLTMAAHRYRRNELKYNIPGGSVADQSKHIEYDNAAARLAQEYGIWIARKKRELNIEEGWSTI
jgi:hypothetical protein